MAQIEPFVYEWTSSRKGSVSAEHGIGFMKVDAVYYSKPVEAVRLLSFFNLFDLVVSINVHIVIAS